MAPRRPQDGPKTTPRRLQVASKSHSRARPCKLNFTISRDAPKIAPGPPQGAPRAPQEAPKRTQEAPKRPPRRSQEAPRRLPRGSQEAPRRLKRASQDAPKRLPRAVCGPSWRHVGPVWVTLSDLTARKRTALQKPRENKDFESGLKAAHHRYPHGFSLGVQVSPLGRRRGSRSAGFTRRRPLGNLAVSDSVEA